MGRFKNDAYKSTNIFNNFLIEQGYEDNTGARGEKGLTKIYSTCNGLYDVWVTINIDDDKIYIYKEYECGGYIGDDDIHIREDWKCDLETFIDKIDGCLSFWIDS